MLEREGIIWSLRIQYGHSWWHHVVWDMMITNDKIYAKALGIFYHSTLYQLMRDGVSDMHCMSDEYLTEDLCREYHSSEQAQ